MSMSVPVSWLLRSAALLGSCLFVVAAGWGQTQTAPAPARKGSQSKKVDPQINAQFQKGDVKGFIKRFESGDREVYVKRQEILKVLGLEPGMAVADIGAGSGLFTRLMADEVGTKGKVYAVDVSKTFLDYIASKAKEKGQGQIVTIRGTQDSTNLPANSIDVAFLCDVYHHLEKYEKVLESIHQAPQSPWCPRAGRIRPGGGGQHQVRTQAHPCWAGGIPARDRGRRVRAGDGFRAPEAQGELRREVSEEGPGK